MPKGSRLNEIPRGPLLANRKVGLCGAATYAGLMCTQGLRTIESAELGSALMSEEKRKFPLQRAIAVSGGFVQPTLTTLMIPVCPLIAKRSPKAAEHGRRGQGGGFPFAKAKEHTPERERM